MCAHCASSMHVPIASFCSALGWLVVWQSAWCNPFLPHAVRQSTDVCLITQRDLGELSATVEADDGRVYDAAALREWLIRCQSRDMDPCVIPTQPITSVRPVRVRSAAGWLGRIGMRDGSRETAEEEREPPRKRQCRSIATQTDRVCAPKRPRIPSEHSAFVRPRV